jgi:adenosylcobinamide-GDP ribazoletransferase
VQAFLAALHFLTIVPAPGDHQPQDIDWWRATGWYPAVGLLVGIVLAGLDWGLSLVWPRSVTGALVLAAWVALTGALHLDGFVDSCDALLASVPRGRRLEILRDVHAGTFGLVGAVLLLLAKYATLVSLPAGLRGPSLVLVPILGRWTMTAAVMVYPYARPGPGLGRKAKAGRGWRPLALATGTALTGCAIAAWAGLGWGALVALLLSAALAFAVAQWMHARLGGLTGDTYGAICELVEVASLLLLSGLTAPGLGQ